MSILIVENLHKTYGEKTLFDHISFTIAEQQRIGLIGVNGTGKSTLLKVIAELESAEEGKILHANDFHIEYLPQYPELDEELTVTDQIYYGNSDLMQTLRAYEKALYELEMSPENDKLQEQLFSVQQKMDQLNAWEASTIAKTVLTQLGVTDFDKKVNNLSGGQKKRVAIAKALIQPADILILDEPTNHLDNETIEWLEKFLSQYKGALLVVTHDRYFLNRVTNRIFELDYGQLYTYEGNYEVFLEKKAEREEQGIIAEQKHENVLRRELEWLHRGAKARTTKQKARIQRVNEMQEKDFNNTKENIDIALGATRLGKKVIELEGVAKALDGRQLLDNFNYLVVPGERLGIIGPNGSGKSTLLNMIAGRVEPDSGKIVIGETVKIGYYTQEHVEMDGNLQMLDYIKEVAEVIKTVDGSFITAEQMLERFLFPRSMQRTYIRKLSGGERRRLYLLRTLMGEPNVLFLDEPTNDLDTQTLTILEDYLNQFPGVVITVSHDRYFLDRVVDHLISFDGKGSIRRFQGNYSDYLELRNKEKTEELEAAREKAKDESRDVQKKDKKKKLSYKEQQEWNGMEDRIAGLEERLAEIQAEIAAAGNDLGKVQDFYKEQQKIEQELEEAMDRWTELSILVEEIEQEK